MVGKRRQSRGATYVEIANQIRRDILDGVYQPGDQLPTQSELNAKYSSTNQTIQRAIHLLQEDGFVFGRRTHGRGRFVATRLPFRNRIGLIIPFGKQELHQYPMWNSMVMEATAMMQRKEADFAFYYDVQTRSEELQGLADIEEDISRCRISGLLVASHPFYLRDFAFFTQRQVPIAAVMGDLDGEFKDIVTAIKPGCPDFPQAIMERFAELGCKRVAVLDGCSEHFKQSRADLFTETATKCGLEIPFQGYQAIPTHCPQCARHIMRAVLNPDLRTPPDAVYIADDAFVTEATQGILDCGQETVSRVKVIAHANFPQPLPSLVPAIREGLDVSELLTKARAHLLGGDPPGFVQISYMFA